MSNPSPITLDRAKRKTTDEQILAAFAPGQPYSVNRAGAVFSRNKWNGSTGQRRKLSDKVSGEGYPCARIRIDGSSRTVNIHRIVALVFIGRRPSPHHVVRHLDGNKLNNRVENLAWGTMLENSRDMVLHGRSTTKLSEEQARFIIESYVPRDKDTGINALARRFGVCPPTIKNILCGRTWRQLQPDLPKVQTVRMTVDRAAQVRALHDAGGISQHSLAKQFLTSPRTIRRIVAGSAYMGEANA